MLRQFANNASTTLAASITSAATSCSVVSGTGSLFPALTSPQTFAFTFIKSGVPTTREICLCTARSGDTFGTIVRAQEGTTALSWNSGDTVEMRPTAGDMQQFAQFDDLQKQATNYAADTGTANAYSVTLSPALTAHVTGMPIWWLAAHSNTGGSTFNDGVGAGTLETPNNTALVTGDIVAGGLYCTMWNGTLFELVTATRPAFSQITGSIANGQVPESAVTQFTTAILFDAALGGAPTAPTPASGNTSTAVATTAFVLPAYSDAANGYRQNADGTITQWGYSAYGGSGTSLGISFPTAFASACWNVVCSTSVGGYNAGIANYTTTGWTADTTKLVGTAQAIFWRAEGK